MIGKLILFSFLSLTVANAKSIDNFLAQIKVSPAAEPNPCGNRVGDHFARNNRGCSWYFVCDDKNEIVREDRCDNGLHFSYYNQMCDYKDRVKCDLDDRWANITCPEERYINVIPHPYTCSKYTGIGNFDSRKILKPKIICYQLNDFRDD
jgi:Chitin binding Peritrophin-A domain